MLNPFSMVHLYFIFGWHGASSVSMFDSPTRVPFFNSVLLGSDRCVSVSARNFSGVVEKVRRIVWNVSPRSKNMFWSIKISGPPRSSQFHVFITEAKKLRKLLLRGLRKCDERLDGLNNK